MSLRQLALITLGATPWLVRSAQTCRNVPGDPGFPNVEAWNTLNASISGRLVTVVPSGQFCKDRGGCTDAEWTSSVFRNEIPGALNQLNWEQNYTSTPPQICLQTTNGTCAQGDVPLYAVAATDALDVQAGIAFAKMHNIRVSVKASGHDYLGRSTARDSLLIWTHFLQNTTFHDDFLEQGSAVTVGGGLPLNTLYESAKKEGKIFVGGSAATVIAAGGYVQGGGHSALSPLLGLAADNALEFTVVTGQGEYVTANANNHTDLFWALRGGGAGSWGVIISATFKTYPTFNMTYANIALGATNASLVGNLMSTHARHIFDLDAFNASQYFWVLRNDTSSTGFPYTISLRSFLPKVDANASQAAFAPVLGEMTSAGGVVLLEEYENANVNDLMYADDDDVAGNLFMGSRLFPESVYRDSPDAIGKMYEELCDSGAYFKVAENAVIDSAIHPAWRTAKSHMISGNYLADPLDVSAEPIAKHTFQNVQLPIMEGVVETDAGSYSNEADSIEPNFQTTFFGPNYAKLSDIKSKYDPDGLFIVASGVGSEEWDEGGFCKLV